MKSTLSQFTDRQIADNDRRNPMRTRITALLVVTLAVFASSLLVNPAAARDRNRPGPIEIGRPPIHQPQPPADPDAACDAAEAVINSYLPETKTVASSSAYKAKLTIKDGNVLNCDLANYYFEIRLPITLKQYARVPVVGWKPIASTSGQVRVSFTVVYVSSSSIKLTNLQVLGLNINNVPNWFDSTVIKDWLNVILPNTLTVTF
jgi:hypothetical protein